MTHSDEHQHEIAIEKLRAQVESLTAERDELLRAADAKQDPLRGSVQMHGGCHLFWEQNAAGGRTYHSDEIPTGVEVWDTALVDFQTLCEAIAVELALQGVERRATQRRERAELNRRVSQSDMGPNIDDDGPDVPDGPESAGFAPGFEARANQGMDQPHHGHVYFLSDAPPAVRPADDGPCPNCGALGCWTPCPHEPPLPERGPTPAALTHVDLDAEIVGDVRPLFHGIPEGVAAFDGDTLPDMLRAGYVRADFPSLVRAAQQSAGKHPLTHAEVTLRVHLIRARDQLLRYSSEDPMAEAITKLLDPQLRHQLGEG